MLKYGANPNIGAGSTCATPLHLASVYANSGTSILKTVEVFLLNGADPNAKDVIGWTPLHYASNIQNIISTSFLETIKLLLQYNATPINKKTQILKLEIDIENFIEENEKLQQKILLLESEED